MSIFNASVAATDGTLSFNLVPGQENLETYSESMQVKSKSPVTLQNEYMNVCARCLSCTPTIITTDSSLSIKPEVDEPFLNCKLIGFLTA